MWRADQPAAACWPLFRRGRLRCRSGCACRRLRAGMAWLAAMLLAMRLCRASLLRSRRCLAFRIDLRRVRPGTGADLALPCRHRCRSRRSARTGRGPASVCGISLPSSIWRWPPAGAALARPAWLCARRNRWLPALTFALRLLPLCLQGLVPACSALAAFTGVIVMKLLTAALFSLWPDCLRLDRRRAIPCRTAGPRPEDLPERHAGRLGHVPGRSGEVKKRFHVVIDAQWTGRYRRPRRELQVVGRHHLAPGGQLKRQPGRHLSRHRGTTWSARPSARWPAMPCAGATCWRCRSMARPTTCRFRRLDVPDGRQGDAQPFYMSKWGFQPAARSLSPSSSSRSETLKPRKFGSGAASVWLVGASSGIGAALAQALVRGARLALVGTPCGQAAGAGHCRCVARAVRHRCGQPAARHVDRRRWAASTW